MLPIEKLESLDLRFKELEELLCVPEVIADGKRYAALRREHADLDALTRTYTRYRSVQKQLAEDRVALLDPDLREMVEEEIPLLEKEIVDLEKEVELLLLPSDPNDARNTIIEIRSGTGGEEAALFAADLFRMYSRYADKVGWKVELMSDERGECGRAQGSHRQHHGRQGLLTHALRGRRAPRAACSGDGERRPHSHLDGDGGRDAGGR